MSNKQRKNGQYTKSKDIVYGYCKQHPRNVPMVLSNIILKRFDITYFVNDSSKIKDILLPKFNFIQSIVDEINNYFEFDQCETCPATTWSDDFERTKYCLLLQFSYSTSLLVVFQNFHLIVHVVK